MLGVLLTGLLLCPNAITPDGGVVTVEPGTQWILSDGAECEGPTVISPDMGVRIQSVMQAPPSHEAQSTTNAHVKERPLMPKGPAITSNCQPTYRASPVTLDFIPDKDDLTSTAKAGLIEQLSQSPQGVTIVLYVGDGKTDKQFVERMTRRVKEVEVLAKALAGPRSVISKDQRIVERGARLSGMIEVIGIYASTCGHQISEQSSSSQGLALSSGMQIHGDQGGSPVTQ